MKTFLVILALLSSAAGLRATTLEDLKSYKQEIRDAAAKTLRSTYKPTGRTNWDSVLIQLKKGDSKKKLFDLVPPFGPEQEAFVDDTSGTTATYRLDDRWILITQWQKVDLRDPSRDRLIGFQSVEQLRQIWVSPPRNFTGMWVTYFINGQTASVINYKNGKYFGENTTYRSDGSKASVQRYGENGDSEETGYYPSGKMSYKGSYTKGMRSGTWVLYNEDGSVKSKVQY